MPSCLCTTLTILLLLIPIENFGFVTPALGEVQSALSHLFLPRLYQPVSLEELLPVVRQQILEACPSFGHLDRSGELKRSTHGHHVSRAVSQQFSL